MADNSTLRLDLDNEPQPDVSVWIEGGNAFIDEDDYLQGAPELLLDAYRRNGVAEYLVLLTHEQEVRWYSFEDGETAQILPDAEGILFSRIFPGLHLHPALFWRNDLPGLLAVLRRGLATSEHVEFVTRLRANNPNL